MKYWHCEITVTHDVELEAETAEDAKGAAVEWFFANVVHVIDESDVLVVPVDDPECA